MRTDVRRHRDSHSAALTLSPGTCDGSESLYLVLPFWAMSDLWCAMSLEYVIIMYKANDDIDLFIVSWNRTMWSVTRTPAGLVETGRF